MRKADGHVEYPADEDEDDLPVTIEAPGSGLEPVHTTIGEMATDADAKRIVREQVSRGLATAERARNLTLLDRPDPLSYEPPEGVDLSGLYPPDKREFGGLERHRAWHAAHGSQQPAHRALGLSAPIAAGVQAIQTAIAANAAELRSVLAEMQRRAWDVVMGDAGDLIERRVRIERERDWLAHQLRCARRGVSPLPDASPMGMGTRPHPRAKYRKCYPLPPALDAARPADGLLAQLRYAREQASRSARLRWSRSRV